MRRELNGAVADTAARAEAGPPGRRDPLGGNRELEGAAARPRERRTGSPVLDDAREVAARRKRQLGRDRP
jgi:hypothetical protein